jgi:hypothetical protein
MPLPSQHDGALLGGRYRLDAVIGRGGMAVVYRAHDEKLGRPVAVKLFSASAVDPARQEAEMGVLAGLDHHALVNLYDAGIHDDGAGTRSRYLVMALVAGNDLEQRLKESPIASRHIAEIGYDLAEALDYIHSHGVIHRDIKPSNILLVDYGQNAPRARAKLTDFGIALAEDVERLTAEGVTTGTAAYLSPEQARGAHVGAPSDVYSLGLVLLQCFTRRREFPGSLVESAVARLSRDPVIPEPLPDYWRDLLRAMTSQDPEARPHGGELVSLLRQAVIAESGRHRDDDLEFEAGAAGPGGSGIVRDASETGTGGGNRTQPGVLDTLPDEALHRATAMAARLLDAPMSIASVLDQDRTWFASHFSPDVGEIARQIDLSPAAVPASVPIVIPDCRLDPRTVESSLVTGPLGLRFYVGVPLTRHDGTTIGTLSVLGFEPRLVADDEIANLQDLAALVVTQLELRQEGLRVTGEASVSSGHRGVGNSGTGFEPTRARETP